MKLGIITAIHGRYDMTKAFLTAMKRLKEEFDIPTFVAVTKGDESIDMLQFGNVGFVEHENKPLGAKWNAVVELAASSDCTHFMILGSDDIPSSRYIEHVLTLGEYDVSGINGMWFWGLNPRRAGFEEFGFFHTKVMCGAGKVLSHAALDACDYRPWPDNAGFGMDAKMMRIVRDGSRQKHIGLKYHTYSIQECGGFLLDVKYEHHISSMSPITRRPTFHRDDAYKALPNHLPQGECEYLFGLHKHMVEWWAAQKKM